MKTVTRKRERRMRVWSAGGIGRRVVTVNSAVVGEGCLIRRRGDVESMVVELVVNS